jgi:alpha-glucosidase
VVLAVQAALKGTPCLYQGDELALTEADLPFEALQDPYGIPFWPQFKGRDGCRTPMPWVADAPHGGFSSATPWLPVPPGHWRAPSTWNSATPDRPCVSRRTSSNGVAASRNCCRATSPSSMRRNPCWPRRDLPGQPSVLAAFNPGTQAVTFAWPDAAPAADLAGHGRPSQPGRSRLARQKALAASRFEPRASGPNNRVSVLGIVASG